MLQRIMADLEPYCWYMGMVQESDRVIYRWIAKDGACIVGWVDGTEPDSDTVYLNRSVVKGEGEYFAGGWWVEDAEELSLDKLVAVFKAEPVQ